MLKGRYTVYVCEIP